MLREIRVMAEQESRNQGFEVSISAGYAFYDSRQDKTLADTLRRSDACMYRTKRSRWNEKTDNAPGDKADGAGGEGGVFGKDSGYYK